MKKVVLYIILQFLSLIITNRFDIDVAQSMVIIIILNLCLLMGNNGIYDPQKTFYTQLPIVVELNKEDNSKNVDMNRF